MGGRDCSSSEDDKSIHSLPQSWRVPRRRKSRSNSIEGGDCISNSINAINDINYVHSFPSPLKVPRKRKSGKVTGEGRECYDPIEGKMHTLNNDYQFKLKTSNRFSPLMNEDEEQEDILHTHRDRNSSPARKRLRLVCFEDW